MAIVERGKGRNKHTVEVTRRGAMLRLQEIEHGDARLPGYRRCASDEAARAALEAEVRARLADGMKPADDEARAIAAEFQPAEVAAPTFPVRCDLGIYNEATGLVVTTRRMAGKALGEGSPTWMKAVKRGDLLPLTLMQDDPFIIRIVAGGPLTAQESEEWVARVDWHLKVSDGRLCVTGGAPFASEDYGDLESYHEQFVGEVAIPAGHYRAALYTHLHGVNGSGVMDHLAGGYDAAEPLEDWFVRTRPGLAGMPWEEQETVDFLLHLEPVDAAPKSGLSELPEEGWFGGAENAREPERCPLGLAARDVQRRATAESAGWVYVRDTFAMIREHWGDLEPPALTDAGALTLSPSKLACMARVPWFASRRTVLELRISNPGGAAAIADGAWPENVVATDEDGVTRLLFSAELEPEQVFEVMGALAPCLGVLPVGTLLELCAAPVEYQPVVPEVAGWFWLRGTVDAGDWTVTHALPTVSGAILQAALVLAEEVDQGTRITLASEGEGHAILDWARRNFGPHLAENPPRQGKEAITFAEPGHEVRLLGAAAFAVRFAEVWPVLDLGDTAEWDDDEEDDDLFSMQPVQGALLHTTAGGRRFHQTMALLISEGVETAVRAQERELKKAGFSESGDVVCNEFEMLGYHGYRRADGLAAAWFRTAYPDEATCEIVSLFAGDALLLTSANANVRHRASKGVHVQESFGAPPAALAALHEARLAELQAKLGAPRELPAGVQGLAEVLAVVLDKG